MLMEMKRGRMQWSVIFTNSHFHGIVNPFFLSFLLNRSIAWTTASHASRQNRGTPPPLHLLPFTGYKRRMRNISHKDHLNLQSNLILKVTCEENAVIIFRPCYNPPHDYQKRQTRVIPRETQRKNYVSPFYSYARITAIVYVHDMQSKRKWYLKFRKCNGFKFVI